MVRMVQTLTNNSDDIMYVVPQTLIRRDGDTERDRTSFTGPVLPTAVSFTSVTTRRFVRTRIPVGCMKAGTETSAGLA